MNKLEQVSSFPPQISLLGLGPSRFATKFYFLGGCVLTAWRPSLVSLSVTWQQETLSSTVQFRDWENPSNTAL